MTRMLCGRDLQQHSLPARSVLLMMLQDKLRTLKSRRRALHRRSPAHLTYPPRSPCVIFSRFSLPNLPSSYKTLRQLIGRLPQSVRQPASKEWLSPLSLRTHTYPDTSGKLLEPVAQNVGEKIHLTGRLANERNRRPTPCVGGGVGICRRGPVQSKLEYTGKWLWDTKSRSTTTNTTTQMATFNIWTPAASCTGPGQLAVYWDTVYRTFVFYPL
jgi:hypothetical protein